MVRLRRSRPVSAKRSIPRRFRRPKPRPFKRFLPLHPIMQSEAKHPPALPLSQSRVSASDSFLPTLSCKAKRSIPQSHHCPRPSPHAPSASRSYRGFLTAFGMTARLWYPVMQSEAKHPPAFPPPKAMPRQAIPPSPPCHAERSEASPGVTTVQDLHPTQQARRALTGDSSLAFGMTARLWYPVMQSEAKHPRRFRRPKPRPEKRFLPLRPVMQSEAKHPPAFPLSKTFTPCTKHIALLQGIPHCVRNDRCFAESDGDALPLRAVMQSEAKHPPAFPLSKTFTPCTKHIALLQGIPHCVRNDSCLVGIRQHRAKRHRETAL